MDFKKRLTVKQVLEHPWVLGKESVSAAPLAMQQEQLKKFTARGRFKRAIHTVVATNRMKELLGGMAAGGAAP